MSLALDIAWSRPDFQLQVECQFPGRGITALFGRSGSGKTTVLRCVAGLERVPRASVRFNGEVWQDQRRFVPTHQRPLGYVFQESSLFAHLDVHRNLEYGLHRVPAAQRRIGFDQAVQFMGVERLLTHRADQLSGGQRQRVAIARALLTSPQLLLMDEPLSSLDLASRAEILPHLERLHDELSIPIVYVSHEIGEVMRIADHIALLDAGRVHAFGSLHEMLTRPDLPLAHLEEAGSVFEGVIAEHDPQYHLSYVGIAAGRLAISLRAVPVGQRVRVRIDARDVSLALKPPEQTSITNILPGRVMDVTDDRDPAQRLVRIDVGGRPLLARITQRSVAQLAIAPGTALYAQVKSVALMD
ncbi:MAG TPA: molybdenum ABC transporter ATP-binding protein [Steroidobacteraceae bacterium]|nr:molybdenum ABC transporter ATP-binding protein [Steroidobacteraceae bacterium]